MFLKILLAIILALYPVIHQIITIIDTKKKKTFKFYKKNLACYILDWLFVPFNFFLIFAVDWNNISWFIGLLVISAIGNILSHYHWTTINKGYMFNSKRKPTFSGWLHYIFSTIQITFIGYFLLFMNTTIQGFIAWNILLIFNIFMPVSSYIIFDGKPLKSDIIASIVLFVLLMIRLFI